MQPTFDAAGSGGAGTSGNTLSWTHVLGNLTNPLILVGVCGEDFVSTSDPVVSSVTFNGIAMTRLGSVQGPAGSHIAEVELWALWGSSVPVAGSYTVAVTFAGNTDSRKGGSASFGNVKQATAEAIGSKARNATTPLQATLTTLTNFALVFSVYGSQNGGTVTHDSDMTEVFAPTTSGEDCKLTGAYKIVPSASFVTVNESLTNPESEGMVIASFPYQSFGGGYFI